MESTGTFRLPVSQGYHSTSYRPIFNWFMSAGIGQSVWPFASGWAVRGSRRCGGEIFCTRPGWPWGSRGGNVLGAQSLPLLPI